MPGFLDLPYELREIIYRMLFPKQDVHIFEGGVNIKGRSRTYLNIIRVSCQIAKETLPILYSQNSFRLEPGGDPPNRLCQISQANRDYLCHVIYYLLPAHSSSAIRSFEFLAQCSHICLTIGTTTASLVWGDSLFQDSPFRNLYGFTSVCITSDPAAQQVSSEHDHHTSSEAPQRRFEKGTQTMLTSCPRCCWVHTGQAKSQATASIHIIFCDLHCSDRAGYIHNTKWKERIDTIFKPS